jgi:hypothetical protein
VASPTVKRLKPTSTLTSGRPKVGGKFQEDLFRTLSIQPTSGTLESDRNLSEIGCSTVTLESCLFGFPHPLLVISAPLSQVKSPYAHSKINPNRILQSLIAVLAGLNIPFLCTETHELGEEVVASYLYQIHLYDWLETNHYGRFLFDNDL